MVRRRRRLYAAHAASLWREDTEMKNINLVLAAIGLSWAWSGAADAACDFNIAPARGFKASMVRVYAACPSTIHPTGNTQTGGGTDACTPVMPAEVDGAGTLYSYGPRGGCSVDFKAKVVPDCADLGLPSGACHVTFVKSKCRDILGPDGMTPIGSGDGGFTLAAIIRVTLGDDENGDSTLVDLPATFAFDDPEDGKMQLSSNTVEALIPVVGAADAGLSDCASYELVSLTIKDPAFRPFATLGGATAP